MREVEKRTGLVSGLASFGRRSGCLEARSDQLRADPMLAVAVEKADPLGENRRQASDRGKALAGKCTLNRLELSGARVDDQERYKKIAMDGDKYHWMVDAFLGAHESAPEEIVLDLDATDDTIHGHQEGRFYHGYYGNYCYLPLYIFAGEHLLCARLRRSNIDGADGSIDELERIVGQIRQSWPDVSIIVRADSGFCRDELLGWCADHQVDYVVGLAKNSRLKREIAEQMTQAEAAFSETGKPARVFKDFRYHSKELDHRQGRVPGKRPIRGDNVWTPAHSMLLLCATWKINQGLDLFARPDQRDNYACQPTPALSLLQPPTCSCMPCAASDSGIPIWPALSAARSFEAPQNRGSNPPDCSQRLDLHVWRPRYRVRNLQALPLRC